MSRWMLVLLAVLDGCALAQAPRIPMKIAPEEYEVYTAWLLQRPPKQPPVKLYLTLRTHIVGSLESCIDWLKIAGVEESMIQRLTELGEAQFPFDLEGSRMKSKVDFEVVPEYSKELANAARLSYELISFSRVAFDASHTKALFGVHRSCGGLCGGGVMVLGRREKQGWVFKDAGCAYWE